MEHDEPQGRVKDLHIARPMACYGDCGGLGWPFLREKAPPDDANLRCFRIYLLALNCGIIVCYMRIEQWAMVSSSAFAAL